MDGMQDTASEHDEASESPTALPPSLLSTSYIPGRGACEACRSRKIRCNRESPCSQCRRAKLECVQVSIRPREKRARILLTPQYEKKIDIIDDRLRDVTKLLQNLTVHLSANTSPSNPLKDASMQDTVMPGRTISFGYSASPETSVGPAVEGESSLSAHSVFVNDFVQNVVKTDSLQGSTPEIRETLDALSQVVSASKRQLEEFETAYPRATSVPRPQPQRFELPPIHKVVPLVRLAKSQRLAGTGWVYEFITMQSFGDRCLDVYFSNDRSHSDSIIVNAGLYSLCYDYARLIQAPSDEKEEYSAYSRLCRENLETGLANLPLHLSASSDAIAALLFGTFYCMELSKPTLCWTLSSKASELCQTLGYHRAVPTKNETQEGARYNLFLFWTTYFVDKSLSLRLGRASTIPDWDISIDLPSAPGPDRQPVLAYFALWIRSARCQGNIYEMLYSPDSIKQPDSVRQSRVEFLVSSLQQLEKDTVETNKKWFSIAKEASGEDLMDFFAVSDDILRLSLLTHVYRAGPRAPNSPTTFSSDCINAARATLEKHHDVMAIIRKTDNIYFQTYVHWTLLFAPFVPFIVIFCHVIETQDHTDLAQLHAFITSIQAAPSVSEPAARMHSLFQVLHNVAARYVEYRNSATHKGQSKGMTQFDNHLATLGFPHAGICQNDWQQRQQAGSSEIEAMHNLEAGESANAINPLLWLGNGMQLEDWFYINQESMELLQGLDVDSVF
ncbi:fungal-specific transcription factor domain-containing protein [Dactylonectria estremocensis]|uniref:Fungal-specific transcription factor domain-containing protein n=1 Tax=Dactylonectria estremocensis TaxID=1079267 RepID=A0A9P9EQL7_9HYPO|nr:fungal-specific transcription factor domain-containing protein [Dactylonectria estremocensis]